MNARTLTCLLLLGAGAVAQQSPFRSPLFDAGNQAWNAAAGDVDGDGDADLVTNDFSWVRLLLQNSPGSFGPPVDQTFIHFVGRMQLADFDQDGDADVAAQVDLGSPSADDYVAVMLSDGGELGDATLHVTSQDPTDIAIADLDEDGELDLALPCEATSFASTGTRISLFFGLGDGGFTPKLDVLAGLGPRGIDVADIDLDGHLDMAVINDDGTLRALLGDGAGGFTLLAGTELGFSATDVALGDVDADGDPDALAGFESNKFRLALGDGAGGWSAQPILPASAQTIRIELQDVDEDGDADAIGLQVTPTTNPAKVGFVVALSQGDGSFASPVPLGSGANPKDLVVADLTQDGDLDLLAVNGIFMPAGTAVLLPGDGRGGFGGPLETVASPSDAVLSDLDLDGRPELIVAGGNSGFVAVHPGLAHGAFGTAQLHLFPAFPSLVASADLVEDGLPDLLVSKSSNPGRLTVRAGDGALGFGPAIHTDTTEVPWGMGIGDADLDGHVDVVIGGFNDTVQVLLGDGAGSFVLADVVSEVAIGCEAAAFADLDADGLPDVAATTRASNKIVIARGVGGGQFADATLVPIPHYHQHDLAIADIDGDDDLDLFTSGGFAAGPNVVFNDGAANFSAGPTLTAADTQGVGITDADGDGHADLVVVAETTPGQTDFGAVLTWRGLGGGAFAAPVFGFLPRKSQELLLEDFDGDGARDVGALAFDSAELWLLPSLHGPWTPLGKGLAGVQGVPRQQGFGTLVPGQPFEFLLTDARPAGSSFHVIGLSTINAPFKGGTLVPAPLLLTGPWPLDGQGELSLQGPWPGPAASGVGLWFQFLTSDPAAPKGFSLSTAMKATLP